VSSPNPDSLKLCVGRSITLAYSLILSSALRLDYY